MRQRTMTGLLAGAVLCIPLASLAADKVCGDATQFCDYMYSVERSIVHTYSCEVWPRTEPATVISGTCEVVPSGQGEAARAFMDAHEDQRKLAVVGSMPVEKDAATIAAIDAQDAEQAALLQALALERVTNELCVGLDLEVLEDKIVTAVDATHRVKDAIAVLTELLAKVARCLIARSY